MSQKYNTKSPKVDGDNSPFLDQFSTSPTKEDFCSDFPPHKCSYNAPFFAYNAKQKTWIVVQGNCHHWDCKKCGIGRAKKEYGRIIEGCRTLAKAQTIYFITITCKGKGLGVKDAEKNYLKWTNRLLDACRQKCKRAGGQWYYVQVTERQKRKHPHSHILTTFVLDDIVEGVHRKYETDKMGRRVYRNVPALRSSWFEATLARSGLGMEYDISRVETVEGASRYVAKYLFKDSIFTTDWPKGWKRVRYSQSFPKLPERKTDAFVLLNHADWYRLATKSLVIHAVGFEAFEEAKNQLHFHDTIIRLKTTEAKDGQ